MDLMDIRREMMGVIAKMASGHVRMASGEFNHTGGVVYLNHNLGSGEHMHSTKKGDTNHEKHFHSQRNTGDPK